MMSCPVCSHRGIGKVGSGQYFCRECCVEFSVQGSNITVFTVEADGSLTSCANLLQGIIAPDGKMEMTQRGML